MPLITTITAAALSQLQTTTLVSTVVSSFIGSKADKLICNSSKHLYNKIKDNLEEPGNHDIQKVVRKAYLNATLLATEDLKNDDDLKAIKSYIKKELAILEKTNTRFLKTELNEKFEVLLKSKGVTVEKRLPEIILALKESILDELRLLRLRVPAKLKARIFNGWEDEGKKIDWHQLMCAFASEEFKTNERIRAVIQTNYLAIITSQNQDIIISLDNVIDKLEALRKDYKVLLQKIDIILLTVSRTEQKINILDKKVDHLTDVFEEKIEDLNNIQFNSKGFKASDNYKNIKLKLTDLYQKEENIKVEIEDYKIEVEQANSENLERKKRLLQKAKMEQLAINKEKLKTEENLENLINDVLKLAKLLDSEEFSNNPKLEDIKTLFQEGKYNEVNIFLSEESLYKELKSTNKKIKELSQKFIVKAQTVVIEKDINWFELANKYYKEALNIYESHTYLFDYAYFLGNNNIISKAIIFYSKAIDIYRKLNLENPNSYQNSLALTLNNIANLQLKKNDFINAEKNYLEALTVYKKIALNNSDKYLPDIARTLNNFAILKRKNNDFINAEKNYMEALSIYKKLASYAPNKYLPYVAHILNNLAIDQAECNDFVNAKKNYMEALEIRKKLTLGNSDTFMKDLSFSLDNLASFQLKNNNLENAEKNYMEALEIRRKLALDNPNTYISLVADTLNNIGILKNRKNDFKNAEKNHIEALEIRKILALDNPEAYLEYLTQTLNNLGITQEKNNDFINAEKNYIEALEIRRKLALDNPKAHLSNLSSSLNNLANLQSKKNDFKNAEKNFLETLKIRKQMVSKNPTRYDLKYANSLLNFSVFYSKKKPNREESLKLVQKALKHIKPYLGIVPLAQKLQSKAIKITNYWNEN